MILQIPYRSLVLLIGPAGSGKSSFARQRFRETQIVSSDTCRAMLIDDDRNQAVSGDAFELLHQIVDKRLALKRLTVVDATNLKYKARQPLLSMAARHHFPAIGLVFDIPEEICRKQDAARHRQVGADVVAHQHRSLHHALPGMGAEGFASVVVLSGVEEVDGLQLQVKTLRDRVQG
jgi:protein phosphatase